MQEDSAMGLLIAAICVLAGTSLACAGTVQSSLVSGQALVDIQAGLLAVAVCVWKEAPPALTFVASKRVLTLCLAILPAMKSAAS